MADDLMHYDVLVEDALRGVVRAALTRAAEDGLPGMHHFYIGFRTSAPGVEIPDYLRQNFPDEMTIVLQHRFWGLELSDEFFEVTLSFNKRQERLHIPYAALTSFLDPSVQFGLQFQQGMPQNDSALVPATMDTGQSDDSVEDLAEAADTPKESAEAGANIVTLDAFRKK